ncbi:hypothetical protein T05_3173 [Trichinella murrelli]|uniref:Uncharacterized protein n=1 Tax=Trichinella murrelli TaxID=144512 RepID=A0A0V0TKB1_9BILA|nr:hypothetical protein T05_3173 [Trichinella murrelli]
MITNGLVVGCVICQLTAASNGVEISLLCVIVKLLMGFNCERWTDDMGDLRNFFFSLPLWVITIAQSVCSTFFYLSELKKKTYIDSQLP